MRRRDILMLLGVVPITPLGAAAQSRSGKTWRIAFFYGPTGLARDEHVYGAFVQGMRQLGHTEGQDFIIDDFVYDADKPDEAAREIVQHHVDLILATQSDIVLAAKRATRDIPIVFVVPGDPVANGIVASMSRPGGNATGLTSLNASLPQSGWNCSRRRCQDFGVWRSWRAEAIRQQVASLAPLATPHDRSASIDNLEGTLTAVVKAGGEAVIIAGSPFFFSLQPRIAQWAEAAQTPVISPWRELPVAGGLLSYGTSVSAMFRRAAVFVDRILKGEDPATLPVEQPTTFELVVNLKTAKALGLTIPPMLLAHADEVIE